MPWQVVLGREWQVREETRLGRERGRWRSLEGTDEGATLSVGGDVGGGVRVSGR